MQDTIPYSPADITADNSTESNPTSQEQRNPIFNILSTMKNVFLQCAKYCDNVLYFTDEHLYDDAPTTLSLGFAAQITNALLHLENLIYSYEEHAVLEPSEIWRYICNHRFTSCDTVGLQRQEDMLILRIPHMGRKGFGKGSLANKMLSAKIFAEIDNFPTWHNWHADFFHVYPTSTRTMPRDVDNYDYKQTIDLLAFALGTSDNAIHYSMSMRTVFTDEIISGLYIEIRPKSWENQVLPAWKNRGRGRPRGSKTSPVKKKTKAGKSTQMPKKKDTNE